MYTLINMAAEMNCCIVRSDRIYDQWYLPQMTKLFRE